MTLRFNAATRKGWDSPEYAEALADFERFFPGDPSVEFILIDQYMMRKQYDKLHAALDAIDQAVGIDAHLLFLRGATWRMAGDPVKATAALEKAVAAEPARHNPHAALLDLALEQKDWPAVSRYLTRLDTATTLSADRIVALPSYAPYRGTDECRAWRARRAPAKPTTP